MRPAPVQALEHVQARTSRAEQRSPWHGLTASEAAELDEATRDLGERSRPRADVLDDVAALYATRTVLALTGNDLRLALRCATIARRAMTERDDAREWDRRLEPVEQLHRDA